MEKQSAHSIRCVKIIRIFLLLWVAAATLLLGGSELDSLNNAALFLLVPLIAFFFLLLLRGKGAFSEWFSRANRVNLWASLALTLLFLLLLSAFDLFHAPIFSAEKLKVGAWKYGILRVLYVIWNFTGLLGAVILSVFGCFMALFSAFLAPHDILPGQAEPRPFGISIYTWIIGAIGLICALSFSPILFEPSGDSEAVYYHATHALYNDFHPVTYQFFVALCSATPLGARPIPLIEWFFFTLAFHRGEKLLSSIHPRGAQLFFVLVAALFFPMLYLESLTKDVLYTIALFSLAIRLLGILRGEGRRGWRWIAVFIWMFVAISFRHDGMLPILLLAFGVILYALRRRHELVLPFVLSVVSAFAAFLIVTEGIAFGLFHAERNPSYTAFGTPMLLLSAVADSDVPMDDGDIALMEKVMPLDDWRKAYNTHNGHYTVDQVSRSWGVPGERIERVDTALGLEYVRLCAKYVFRCPNVLFRAFLSANNITWEITLREDAPQKLYVNIYDLYDGGMPDPETDHYNATGFSKLSQNYAHFLENSPILSPFFVRGGIPLLLTLFALIVLIRKRRCECLLVGIALYASWAVAFLLLCSQDQRYIMPFRMWVTFLLPYAYCISPNEEK